LANGGKIVNGPMQVPGGDWIAQGIDPQGAMFAVHSLKPASKADAPKKAKAKLPKKSAKPSKRKVARKAATPKKKAAKKKAAKRKK
jgi:hypothetical protein